MPRETQRGSRLLVAAILLAALFGIDRVAFSVRDRAGSFCDSSSEGKPVTDATPVPFSIDNPCFATGVQLAKGSVYRFEVEDNVWHDGRLRAGPDGLEDVPVKLIVFGPFRRHVEQPWMKLMGRVGRSGGEAFAIGSGLAVYEAGTTGELFLYVNDAVIGSALGRRWAWPYYWSWGRNAGKAKVTVSQIHGFDRAHTDGFHSHGGLISMLFFCCGGIELAPPVPTRV